jgi:hypothetical protein
MRLRKNAQDPGGQEDQPAQVDPVNEVLPFNHWTWRRPQADDAIDEALRYGAVSAGRQAG